MVAATTHNVAISHRRAIVSTGMNPESKTTVIASEPTGLTHTGP